MSVIQRVLTDRVECDKPGCGAVIKVPDPHWATYDDAFRAFLITWGWSLWVSRVSRYYCRNHGPSPRSNMRRAW